METLAALLDDYLRREGVSSREFDRRSAKAGHRISYTTINEIRNGRHSGRFERSTLDAIAAVTGLDRERVYAAAGLRLPSRPFADDLPDGVDYLGQDERNALIGVIRVFLKHADASLASEDLPENVVALLAAPGPGVRHPALESVTRYPDSQPPDVDSPESRAVARKTGRKPHGGGRAGDDPDG